MSEAIKADIIMLDEPCRKCGSADIDTNATQYTTYAGEILGIEVEVRCKHREVCKYMVDAGTDQSTSDGLEGVYERSGSGNYRKDGE